MLPNLSLRVGAAATDNQDDGISAEGLAPTDGIEAFTGLGFNAYLLRLDTKRSSKIPPHGGYVGSQLGALESDGRIDVHYLVAGLVEQFTYVVQEGKAGSVVPLQRIVGKMLADVAQSGGTQEGVADGMGQRVTVRVTQRTLLKWYSHPTYDQLAPCRQTMDIVPQADAINKMALDG